MTQSDGTVIANNRYADAYKEKLVKAQKNLSRKKCGSHSYEGSVIKKVIFSKNMGIKYRPK